MSARGAYRIRAVAALLALLCVLLAVELPAAPAAHADSYTKISGAGSTWSSNALDQWRRNVTQYGMTVNYAAVGSSVGREQFKNGVSDFGVSEIPYGLTEFGVKEAPPKRGYAYMPIVAGGTSFMYNLKIGGKRVTNLRLSGAVLTKIFTGKITMWNAPEVAADNPGLTLPARRVIPVVRSDGSGTTAQFSTWMAKEQSGLWNDYCRRAGKPTPCGLTSYYPVIPGSGFTAQSGSLGVSGYVRQPQAEGAITYVEYSYAIKTGFPVAKLLNSSGYYVEPTASSVAVGLMSARINDDKNSTDYLTQILDNVYRSGDRRAYPLSSYSYMIVPTTNEAPFTEDKGRTLGAFAYYFLCEGQQQADQLGYSPLPINLVQAGLSQVRRIPGVEAKNVDIKGCRNPTFSSDGSNTLARNAPYPQPCDQRGTKQCSTGTAGAKNQRTPVKAGANGGSSSGGSSGVTGGTTAGTSGGTAGGTAAGGTTAGATTAGATTGTTGTTAIDPDTGEQLAADSGGGGDTTVAGNPVSLAADGQGALRTTLMALSAILLLGVVVGPPIAARALGARGARTPRKGAGA
ncbi:phosphate ABC transporter substrate-binding protein PstS [Streptomyces sp. RKAG337]|uniref:phosphate ABC transporter substrate-binding protein PstS n=1 Tax=Streptomyces sp. RKAG337 TaxID=2893404 RepID=UPI0020342576|nr:phosphate ABC transporter substrate-binding protein PstS [Streptomyces sp. RKAG337]MCM2426547.1 phosphate ABC transporter substrate-binding protein PstS [Streptomyces sp. RKAG337]